MDVKSIATNEAALQKFAAMLAKTCPADAGLVIFLRGELGAGKTTFVRGFLRGLGYQHHVKSPTYTYVESYHLDQLNVHHFDLYRVKDPHELEQMGLREFFSDASLCLIEWPEYGDAFLPTADLICQIDFVPQGRSIHLIAASTRGQHILERLGYAH